MKNRKTPWWLPVLLVLPVIAAVWLSGAGRGEFRWDDLMESGLSGFREGNKTYSLDKGDAYGAINRGPYFSLPAGDYTLEFAIETDADNVIRIETSNGARVEPAEIIIPADTWTAKQRFTLIDDAENLQIRIGFENGTYLKLHDITMSTSCTDGLWLFSFAALALAVLYALERAGWLTVQRKRTLLVIGLAVLIASVPAMRENLNAGHDSEFHRMRLRNTASALAEGQFPVRVGGSMYNGYGSAASIFYPDVCFYLPALLMLGGATIQFAMSVFIAATNIVTAACTYALGRRMFASRTAGTGAAVLYLLASYRLTDIYTRMAAGEAAAMAVIPLFALGLWEVVFGEKKRWPLLAVGATAVFMTHMISTVLCAAAAAVVCACCLPRLLREKRLAPIALAIGVTVLLNAYYLVPLLHYMLGGVSMGALNSSVAAGAMEPMYLFAADSEFPRDIGPALLLGAAMAAYALMGRKDERARTAKALLLVGAALSLMTTNLFPWAQLESRLGAAVNFLQFPWRLMMFVDLALALAAGYGVRLLAEGDRAKDAAVIAVLAVSVLSAMPQIARYTTADNAPYRYWLSNSQMITAYAEYTIPGSDLSRTVGEHEVLTDGDAWFTDYEKRGTRAELQARASQGGCITLPMFAFDGYRAELDGREIAFRTGENNRLTVDIPAGTNARLCVWFEGRALWRAADAVSLLTALLLAAGAVLSRRASSPRRAAMK
ncbi:MAG: hypothetical protein IJD94_01740 [Clostridia bacterium]|nr:hypothetical protein [Clostridia bacterium]